jgi:hypothetical protein
MPWSRLPYEKDSIMKNLGVLGTLAEPKRIAAAMSQAWITLYLPARKPFHGLRHRHQ